MKIWQADNDGIYIHSRVASRAKIDGNFQGFGRFSTDLNGKCYFRCMKPVRYTGRSPHIHVAVEQSGRCVLTTQLYIRGEKLNDQDFLFLRENDPKARETLLVDFDPLKGSKTGELNAELNIVLGITPNEDVAG